MWRSRTFWQLFGTQAILLLMAIGFLGVVIVRRIEDRYLAEIRDHLQGRAAVVAELVRDRPIEQLPQLQERLTGMRGKIGTRITLLAEDGRVLADTDADPAQMENHADRPEIQAAREEGVGFSTRLSTTVHEQMLYGTLRTGEKGQAVAYVRVAWPLASIQEELAKLRGVVWTTAAATAICSLLLAIWLSRRITQPLSELTQVAGQIAGGDFGRTVDAVRQDEIGQLAQAFNDMSQRLEVQVAQLQQDREQLRAILGAMVEGVVALDSEQRILFANDCAADLLEFHPQTAVGRRLWEVVRHRALHGLVQRALASSEPCEQELSWKGAGSKNLTAHAVRLVEGPYPTARGAVLVLHDTTKLRRLERLRQEFVANVSHELKTPLAVIKACIETLLDGAIDDVKHRVPFLDRISEQGDRLHLLILDLLSLARIESGAEAFELKAVPLAPLVATCLERHQSRAQAKGQTLVAAPPQVDDVVWADEEAVSQILENLVDNAVKYTPERGCITVRWRMEKEHVCLEVQDTGIGIPDYDLPRIFERFYRVDKARSRELGGTGLGLSIVKHLVQAMEGAVSATSRLGQGTTFHIWLPLASASEMAVPKDS